MSQLYDRALRPAGLVITQFTLLQALELTGGATAARLGRLLAIDTTTLSRTLRPLERRGWIAGAHTTDRRARRLELTLAGRRQLARAGKRWARVQAQVRRRLGRRGWQRLLAGVEQVTLVVAPQTRTERR